MGAPKLTCRPDGSWDDRPPMCRLMDAKTPRTPLSSEDEKLAGRLPGIGGGREPALIRPAPGFPRLRGGGGGPGSRDRDIDRDHDRDYDRDFDRDHNRDNNRRKPFLQKEDLIRNEPGSYIGYIKSFKTELNFNKMTRTPAKLERTQN